MYLNGYYVEKNEREAFEIYMRCLDTMTDEAAPKVAGPVYIYWLGKMLLRGLGTEKKLESALICYQKAESYLFSMVTDGDSMYRNSLMAAIKGQEEVRKEMLKQLRRMSGNTNENPTEKPIKRCPNSPSCGILLRGFVQPFFVFL